MSSVVKASSMRRILLLFVCGFLTSSAGARAAADDTNAAAERYAHLVLALGQHDPDYVDAFYGPAEWKTQAEKEKKSLDAIGEEAAELSASLAKIPNAATSSDEMLKLRREYLQKQISALAARVRALRRRRADLSGFALRSDHRSARIENSGSEPDWQFEPDWRFVVAALRKLAEAVHDSKGKT